MTRMWREVNHADAGNFRDGFNCDLTRTYIQLAEGRSNLEKNPSMKKTFIWLAVTLLLFTACKKTETQTQAEINASALKSSFLPGNISSVTVFNLENGTVIINGSAIDISDNGLATIRQGAGISAVSATFNLGLMKSYEVGGTYLNLYF